MVCLSFGMMEFLGNWINFEHLIINHGLPSFQLSPNFGSSYVTMISSLSRILKRTNAGKGIAMAKYDLDDA